MNTKNILKCKQLPFIISMKCLVKEVSNINFDRVPSSHFNNQLKITQHFPN